MCQGARTNFHQHICESSSFEVIMQMNSHICWQRKFLNMLPEIHAFKHAFSSSAGVLLGMTGSVCLKSPAMTNVRPPNRVLLPRMSWRVLSNASNALLCDMITRPRQWGGIFPTLSQPWTFIDVHTGVSSCERFNGSMNVEWAFLSPFSRVAAMPEDATASAIFLWLCTFAKRRLIRNVLPVLPGASRKRNPPLCDTIRCKIVS